MARDYQSKKNMFPRPVYMQTIYFIRGHDDRCEEYRRILEGGGCPPDGTPRGTNKGDPTALKGLMLAELSKKIKAVEDALNCIPKEYRRGVYSNIAYRDRLPDYAHRNTWSRYRSEFIGAVAKNMRFV